MAAVLWEYRDRVRGQAPTVWRLRRQAGALIETGDGILATVFALGSSMIPGHGVRAILGLTDRSRTRSSRGGVCTANEQLSLPWPDPDRRRKP